MMMTPGDRGKDGAKLAYLRRAEHRSVDAHLYDELKRLVLGERSRRTTLLEQAGLIHGARYMFEHVPVLAGEREAYFERARLSAREGCELVFLDPDNGLAPASVSRNGVSAPKYVFMDEVTGLASAGASVMVYQHFPRVERHGFVARQVRDLREALRARVAYAVVGAHAFFTLVPGAGHDERLRPGLERAARALDGLCRVEGFERVG